MHPPLSSDCQQCKGKVITSLLYEPQTLLKAVMLLQSKVCAKDHPVGKTNKQTTFKQALVYLL